MVPHQNSRVTSFPLADHGLYSPSDILRIEGFPYKKTWLYENSTPSGDFVIPVVHRDKRFYKGSDVNEWFEKIGSNYMDFYTGNPC